jgi:peptidoglycan/xylan/chitin deacetylase (PgdA/CDA1 family)
MLLDVEHIKMKPEQGSSRMFRRFRGRYQRFVAKYSYQRLVTISGRRPMISFTFDDFPRSALLTGGDILRSSGVSGTYYVSLGLAGTITDTGTMFVMEDLQAAVKQGHELGCHTFSHCHAWDTDPRSFEMAIVDNRRVLQDIVPGACFKTLSYPIGVPRAQTKRRASTYFSCCRGGGQTFNVGEADLNYLSAYFLEQSRDDIEAIKLIIDKNAEAGGWLIFATHDVCENPTRWGCTPALFEEVVRYSVKSGALNLPVVQAYEALQRKS